MPRRPQIAKDLPPPEDVTAEALREAVEEARQWRDEVDRATRRMETVEPCPTAASTVIQAVLENEGLI